MTYFLPVASDSSVCFLSRSVSLHGTSPLEPHDVCVEVKSSDVSFVTSCGTVETDTAKFWLNSGGLSDANPGDTLELLIESPEFEAISSSTVVPHPAIISSYSMTVRSYFNGNRYFDEFSVELANPSSEANAYLLQLIIQVDTIGAPLPSFKNMKTDDPNIALRKFGNSALDNALFFEDSYWSGGSYTVDFRAKNRIEEGVPYHYTLLVHSISRDMYHYFHDLESSDFSGAFDGSGHYILHTNIDGAQGCFGAMQTSHALLFP